MASFPTLHSGSTAMYPLTRGHRMRSEVTIFLDFSEQRYFKGQDLARFELVFSDVRFSDKELIHNFFNARRGQYDTTWDLTLTDTDGVPVTYSNLQFVSRTCEFRMTKPGRWSASLQVRQTRK